MNSHFRKWWACAVVISIAFPISFAHAGSKPTLIVPPLSGTTNDRARVALIAALKATGKVALVEASAIDTYLRDRQTVSTPKKDSGDAMKLKEGISAYRGLKMDAAIKTLGLAKVGFRNNLQEDGAFEGLRAAQFYLAMCYLAKKDRNQAKEELISAVVLDPDRKNRKLSEKLYSSEVRKLYDLARKEVESKDHGDLMIETKGGGELTYVDGKAFGPAPVRVSHLPSGEHFVRIEAEGKAPYFSSHGVASGENRVVADLKTLRKIDPDRYFTTVAKASDIDHQRASFLDEMGLALGGDIFVLLAPEEAAVRAQLYDQRSQEVSAIVRERSPETLAAKLVSQIDRDGYVVTQGKEVVLPTPEIQRNERALPDNLKPRADGTLSEQIEKKPPTPHGLAQTDHWYDNRWIWIATGVVLIAGGVGLFTLTDIGKTGPTSSVLTLSVPGK